jgi:Uma2 family endonuclease
MNEHCPDDFTVNGEQALLVDRRNEFRTDLVIIRNEGADRSPVLPSDVSLIVEIISRSSRSWDRRGKLKRYADVGIPAYWIIDPLAERIDRDV